MEVEKQENSIAHYDLLLAGLSKNSSWLITTIGKQEGQSEKNVLNNREKASKQIDRQQMVFANR